MDSGIKGRAAAHARERWARPTSAEVLRGLKGPNCIETPSPAAASSAATWMIMSTGIAAGTVAEGSRPAPGGDQAKETSGPSTYATRRPVGVAMGVVVAAAPGKCSRLARCQQILRPKPTENGRGHAEARQRELAGSRLRLTHTGRLVARAQTGKRRDDSRGCDGAHTQAILPA